jgi:hypothetical protein
MANPNFRITIPTSAKPLIDLATLVYGKHQADGAQSPLRSMQSNTWETNGPKITEALQYHTQSEELKRQAENLTKKRDLLLADVKESVKGSRDVLLGIYRNNPRELGEWGYEVNASVAKTDDDDKANA